MTGVVEEQLAALAAQDFTGTFEVLLSDNGSSDGLAERVPEWADRYGLDGYKELEAAGATDIVTVPWVFYGVPMDGELEAKQDGIRQFAADVLEKW